MWRYLPLTVLNTGLVIVLPALLVARVAPQGGIASTVLSGIVAIVMSTALAAAGAALWKRKRRSRDVVYADLLLWGWLRRCWAERRLSQANALYDSACHSGPAVSIELVTSLSRLLEARDVYTHGHSRRVARHATRIARMMHLSAVEVAKIHTAAMVHDVGKLYTPREILNNPGALTDEEYAVVKMHAVWGAAMLANVGDPDIESMVLHHHERIDGRGYPAGLSGRDIPLGARIIAVADTFDAVTSTRAYRAGSTQKKALDLLSDVAGSQLDDAAVAAFLKGYSARRSVAWFAVAAAIPERLISSLQSVSAGAGAGVAGSASVISALSAASVLGVTPGVHHKASMRPHTHLTPIVTHATRTATPAPPTSRAQLRERGRRRVTSSVPGPRSRRIGRAGSPAGISHGLSTPTPDAPGPPATTREPPGAAHEPVETGKPPTLEPPAPPGPPSPPTPHLIPELPPLPSPPPVAIPSVTAVGITVPAVP
jgi:HD domain-containing protein